MLMHATCVAINGRGLLITGPSGSGKSDLALRLIADGAQLVADDQVELGSLSLIATCPAPLRGLIEARYIGLMRVPFVESAPLALIIEPEDHPERLPEPQQREILGMSVPLLRIPYFENSTPAKLKFFLMQETEIL